MEVTSQMTKKNEKYYPLLPLRGLLVYPTMVLHIDVGRERSVAALNRQLSQDNIIFLATQKDMSCRKSRCRKICMMSEHWLM